jgi:hypothetical protein
LVADDVVPLFFLHPQQQVVACNSCIVHQNGWRAFVRLDVLQRCVDRLHVRDVQHDAAHLARLGELLGDSLRARL